MKTSKKVDGFTIVEVLVSIAVAAVVTMSLNQVVTSYVHTASRGRYLNLTNSYAEAKVESLRNIGFNGLSTGSSNLTSELSSQLPPSRSASMTISSPARGLKQIDITITYKDNGQTSSYPYTTYIGELGVGQ